jgi:hypothetical protein
MGKPLPDNYKGKRMLKRAENLDTTALRERRLLYEKKPRISEYP